jgi:hypothetical protein
MTWQLRQADPAQARWPRFIDSTGATIDPPLDELGAGAYQLVRDDGDATGPIIGSPVRLAGDSGPQRTRGKLFNTPRSHLRSGSRRYLVRIGGSRGGAPCLNFGTHKVGACDTPPPAAART